MKRTNKPVTTKGTNGTATPPSMNTCQPTPVEMVGMILTNIRQYEPEEQNQIMQEVLHELSIDRKNAVISAKNEGQRRVKNHEEFGSILANTDTKI